MTEDRVLAAGSFGVLLRRYRLASGLSQEELAQRAGLSVRALANMERGQTRRPYKRSVWLLAEAMALPELQRLDLERASRLVACDAPMPGPAVTGETTPAAGPPPAAAPRQLAAADLAQPPAGHVVPRELPAPVSHFTGRAAELGELSDLIAGGGGCALVICAVGGTAGVGKTALAVQWAHQAAGLFPDGQLYVNLRGYDPDRPVASADALASLLRGLGVPGTDIPEGVEDRAGLYRSRLAGRRVLVLLDNARDTEQVRPLLPGDPGCVAVVTSRDALAGLVATGGARRLDLDLLPLADAVALLRSLIGGRAEGDPEAAAALAGLCARLPLALRIAAELAAARTPAPLAELVAELKASRLDCLDAGEDRADVRTVFSWSLRQLPDDAARAFALIGLHPGADLAAHAAAALTGITPAQARRVLAQLHRASLLQAAGPGRYGMHDLLRAYAREHAAACDTSGQSHQALTRLFDYYLAAAAAAMDILYPAEAHLRPRVARSAAVVPAMPGQADARAWLDTERANLAAVVVHCADHGWPRHATSLAATLFRYLETGGHHPEAVTIHSHARRAAREVGDRGAEAMAVTNLGLIDLRQGRYEQATRYLGKALALHRETGGRVGEARALHNLGIADFEQDRYQQAAAHFREALTLYRGIGDRVSEARTLNNLGLVSTRLGRYQQASDNLEQTLMLCRDIHNSAVEAYALLNLGDVYLRQGRCRQAISHLQQALALFREIGDRTGEAYARTGLGDAAQGHDEPLVGHHEQALVLFRAIGDRSGEAEALNGLGKVFLLAGQADQARAQHAAALIVASQIGSKYQQARAHEGLARAHHACGNPGHARRHSQQALSLFTELGIPQS